MSAAFPAPIAPAIPPPIFPAPERSAAVPRLGTRSFPSWDHQDCPPCAPLISTRLEPGMERLGVPKPPGSPPEVKPPKLAGAARAAVSIPADAAWLPKSIPADTASTAGAALPDDTRSVKNGSTVLSIKSPMPKNEQRYSGGSPDLGSHLMPVSASSHHSSELQTYRSSRCQQGCAVSAQVRFLDRPGYSSEKWPATSHGRRDAGDSARRLACNPPRWPDRQK